MSTGDSLLTKQDLPNGIVKIYTPKNTGSYGLYFKSKIKIDNTYSCEEAIPMQELVTLEEYIQNWVSRRSEAKSNGVLVYTQAKDEQHLFILVSSTFLKLLPANHVIRQLKPLAKYRSASRNGTALLYEVAGD